VRNRATIALISLATVLTVGCAPGPTPSPSSATTAASPHATGTAPSALSSVIATSPSPPEVTPNPVGFAFAADDVVAYYASVGYVCGEPSSSTEAAGYIVRTCERVDSAGRTVTVGLVTDPKGALANAFASVHAAEGEAVLDPVDSMDALSGFLGATLGSDRGGAMVEWLAGHAGDAYAETSDGGLRIATYTPSEGDHTAIFVELANQAYLDAPRPSGG
jgi:hypothetical protein